MSSPLHARAAIAKLKNEISDEPEFQLLFAVVSQAISDLFVESNRDELSRNARESAIKYLNGQIPHAAACNIKPEYVKQVLRKLELI